jgi:hypothetical protein
MRQRLEPMRQLLELELLLEQERLQVLELVQELLPSCRKQPGRKRQPELPEREIYSFLLSLMIKKTISGNCQKKT